MRDDAFQCRILFIAPEVIFFPCGSRNADGVYYRRRGEKTDFFSNLLNGLYRLGLDIHIAQPEYRKLFALFSSGAGRSEDSRIPGHRLHLAHDRAFYYADDIEANPSGDNVKLSLAFQREVIHHLIPTIQPDVIHCYDWMAGLIPAAAKRIGIPCLFTIYDIRSTRIPLWLVEDMGIDVAGFWENLFYQRMPGSYEETRKFNPVDFLLSGIYAADYVNAASMRFAAEVFVRRNSSNTDAFRQLLRKKCEGGCGSADFSGNQTVQEHIGIYRNLLRDVAFSSAN